jgi:hypothetical protein
MRAASRPIRACQQITALVAVLGLAACAGQPPGRTAGIRGVGTPDVSAYVPADQATSLQALLDRCAQEPRQTSQSSGTQGLAASCSQLHRTLHNQPGNAVAGPAL